jgi:hypothetical protein
MPFTNLCRIFQQLCVVLLSLLNISCLQEHCGLQMSQPLILWSSLGQLIDNCECILIEIDHAARLAEDQFGFEVQLLHSGFHHIHLHEEIFFL